MIRKVIEISYPKFIASPVKHRVAAKKLKRGMKLVNLTLSLNKEFKI